MRYWGYLAAKLGISAAIMYGLLQLINRSFIPEPPFHDFVPPRFVYSMGYTLTAGVWFLLCCGVLYLAIWDQRYRCRVCLRRLRMPIETGSWGSMLRLGRPRIEYICPYGHGTLKEEELQISGREGPEWKRNAEIWEELCATSDDSEQTR